MQLAFFGYVGYIAIRYGVQSSVSESYYRLPKSLRWVFTLVTWGYAFCAIYIGLELTGNGLVFLSGVGIGFVGAAPLFHKEAEGSGRSTLEGIVHMVGAIVGITAMQIFLCVVGFWWITLLFAVVSGLLFIWKRTYSHYVWWVEIAAFMSIALFYAIKLIL